MSPFFFSKINCWVCFGSTEDDKEAEWVQPCKCRGTTKWVHQSCLQRWIDEKQKGNSSASVSCPQCNAEYILVFPPFGKLVLTFSNYQAVNYCTNIPYPLPHTSHFLKLGICVIHSFEVWISWDTRLFLYLHHKFYVLPVHCLL